MPWALSSPSSLSWSIAELAGAAGAGGGAACGGASAASCWAQRLAWRRDTRLLTDVAVPAMTAVRATPRSNPGMVWFLALVGDGLERVERRDEGLDGDAAAGDQLAAGPAQRRGDRGRPQVLPDQDRRRGARLQRRCRFGQVLVVDQAR